MHKILVISDETLQLQMIIKLKDTLIIMKTLCEIHMKKIINSYNKIINSNN